MNRIMYRLGGLSAAAIALLSVGCQALDAIPEHAGEATGRRTATPSVATPADADRTALGRFVGVWDFTGWAAQPDGSQAQAAGRAAAAIENEHFVLMDIQRTAGQLSGRSSRKSGSMLLASEPGIGLTLTAWGDASPSISRLVGRVDGAHFTFEEAKTPANMRRISLDIAFESDDRWVANIHDTAASGRPVIASYTFSRRWH